MISLISNLFTLCIQGASRPDRDVNASGNAHPEDKVEAEAELLLFFSCLEINGDEQGKVMSCFQE